VADAPDADALDQAIAALDRWLAAARVPYALIGGIAVSLQATPRFTQDVDVLIWVEDGRWRDLLESAATFGIRSTCRAGRCPSNRSSCVPRWRWKWPTAGSSASPAPSICSS
jgi:hypothetical protein